MNPTKRKYATVFFLILLAVAVSAAISLGDSIFDNSFALDPENVLTDDFNHAKLLKSDTNIHCPPEFTKISNYCDYNGTKIMGWLGIDFTADHNALWDANAVQLSISELDSNNAGSLIADSLLTKTIVRNAVKIFTTTDLDTNTVAWTYRGSCTLIEGSHERICTKTFPPTDVEGVVVGRGTYDSNLNPSIHYAKVIHN